MRKERKKEGKKGYWISLLNCVCAGLDAKRELGEGDFSSAALYRSQNGIFHRPQ